MPSSTDEWLTSPVLFCTGGFSYDQPYLQVLSPYSDLVIAPQINSRVNPFLNLRYRQRFAEHAAGLSRACNKLGIDLRNLTTSQPLELALFDFLSTRLRRGRQVARRQTTARRPAAGGGR